MTRPTRIALALGSGGARGYAHIGVIEVFEERGYEIVVIAGSSMGALVGGLHAAGRLRGYTDWVLELTQRDVLRLMDPSLKAPGAIRGEKLFARVSELLGAAQIEDLPIPFTAVATDLLERKEVWFRRGPVDAAIRASAAIPGFFTPVMINGRLLADGGLMNPVPVAATVGAHADATVAVSLGGERSAERGRTPQLETAAPRPLDEWLDRFRLTVGPVGRDGAKHEAPDPDIDDVVGMGALPAGLRVSDVMALSIEAMQSVVTRYRLAGYPPDVLVNVPSDACRTLDFHRAADMIELGRSLTAQALDNGDAPPATVPGTG